MAGAGYMIGKVFSIPAASMSNPTAVVPNTVASTGGSLAITTYYIVVTFSNANGETSGTTEKAVTLTGSNNSIGVSVGGSNWPAGSTAMNVYASTVPGQETYQGQVTLNGSTFSLNTLAVGGNVPPVSNTTSYQAIYLGSLGLAAGSEFIVQNILYNGPVGLGIYDGTNLTVFDGDTQAGSYKGLSIHVNSLQWLRVFNQSATSTLQISVIGVQTQ